MGNARTAPTPAQPYTTKELATVKSITLRWNADLESITADLPSLGEALIGFYGPNDSRIEVHHGAGLVRLYPSLEEMVRDLTSPTKPHDGYEFARARR